MRPKLGDFLLAIAVMIICAALIMVFTLMQSEGAVTAVITQDGREIKRIRLDAVASPFKVELDGPYHDVVAVEKGRIRFAEADCPDRSCVHTGWLDRSGQTAACLPNRVLIKLVGAQSQVDIISN